MSLFGKDYELALFLTILNLLKIIDLNKFINLNNSNEVRYVSLSSM